MVPISALLKKVGEDIHIKVPGCPGLAVIINHDAGNASKFPFVTPTFARELFAASNKTVGKEMTKFFIRIHDVVMEYLDGQNTMLTPQPRHHLSPEELQLVIANKEDENTHSRKIRRCEFENVEEVNEHRRKMRRVEEEKTTKLARIEEEKATKLAHIEEQNAQHTAVEETKLKIQSRRINANVAKQESIQRKLNIFKEMRDSEGGSRSKLKTKLNKFIQHQLEILAELELGVDVSDDNDDEKESTEGKPVEDETERGDELNLEEVVRSLGIDLQDFRRISKDVGNRLHIVWEELHPGQTVEQQWRFRASANRQCKVYIYYERDRELMERIVKQVAVRKGLLME